MIKTYAVLSALLYPLIVLWLKRRAMRGKEDAARMRERLGHLSMSRPQGLVVWVHAASVGEANSVMPLIEVLHDAGEDIHIVLTTGTVSSASMVAKRLPTRAYHQYVPIDVPFVVRRYVKKLNPDIAIWVESEFWPNMLQQIHASNIPLYLVNARMSERSANHWRLLRSQFLRMMQWFDIVYAGSQMDKQRLHHLGVSAVQYVGNMKYDTAALPYDPKQMSQIMQNIGDRRIWLASSTHPGEEEIVAQAHRMAREVFPDLLTLVVPRHPHRSNEICELFKREKLTISKRSKEQIILPETDIYLADTMGELGIFYRLSGVVFMGGSLIPHGGHNPIEPAQLDCAIICGPHFHNFTSIVDDLMSEQAVVIVNDTDSLAEQVCELLRDHDQQEGMASRAHEAVDRQCGAVEVISKEVLLRLGRGLSQETDASDSPNDEVDV